MIIYDTLSCFIPEAIVVVQEEYCDKIKTQLVDVCAVKMKLEFFPLEDEESGTADVLRLLREKDKIKVRSLKLCVLS